MNDKQESDLTYRERKLDGIDPLPSDDSNALPKLNPGGYKVGITRRGNKVQIEFTSNTEYASIELYDSLEKSLRAGALNIKLGTSNS